MDDDDDHDYDHVDQVALKAVPKSTTPVRDFLIEFHYCYFLSPHHCILDTYDVAFETPEYYVFAQEVAPLGDLWQVMATFFSYFSLLSPLACPLNHTAFKSWPIEDDDQRKGKRKEKTW